MKTLLSATLLSIGLLNMGGTQAAIVNISAGNSTGIDVSLSAGDHVVSWIGTADGGAYDAWSAWSSGSNWLNYILVTNSSGQVAHGTGAAPWYSTPADALTAAQGATFHLLLANAETVNFMVADNIFYDNRGGVSLSVTAAPVPVPAAAWLMGSGLLGLIGVARRKEM